MIFRRLAVLTFALTLALLGLSACTRERTPWPETNSFNVSPGEMIPRFTPHVTAKPPSATPTPTRQKVESPTPAPEQPTPSPTPASNVIIYTVKPGDTLYDIAHQYNVSLQELATINNITDPTAIIVGRRLRIP